ncbi:hypothetical protein GCM10027580_20840 [Corynebacterium faecale]
MFFQQSQTPLGVSFRWITTRQSDQAGFDLAGDLRFDWRGQALFPGDGFFYVTVPVGVGLGDFDHGIDVHSG